MKFSNNYSEVFLFLHSVAVFIAQYREMVHDSSAFYVRERDLLLSFDHQFDSFFVKAELSNFHAVAD